MADYNFLLGAQPVQSPNLLQTAGQAMTLGSMAQQQQLQALNLAKQQDLIGLYGSPQGTQFLQSLLTGGQGMPGQPGAPMQLDASFLSGHPGAPEFIGGAIGLAEKQATLQKAQADTAKSRQEAADMEWQNLGHIAQSVQTDPTQPNYDPQLVQQVAGSVAQRIAAVNPAVLRSFDTSDPGKFLSSVAAGMQDPNKRMELTLKPQELAIQQANLAREQAKFYGGEAFQDPDTKAWYVRTPKAGGGYMITPASTTGVPAQPAPLGGGGGVNVQQPGGQGQPSINVQGATPAQVAEMKADIASGGNVFTPTPGNAGVATNQQGAPVTGPSFQAKEEFKTSQDEMKNLTARSQSASQLQAMLQEMRKQEANGIYSGGVMGTDGAKRMASVLGSMGLLPQAKAEKLANTQVFDADSQQVIADAVSQFAGARIAARELPFFAGTKPSTTQQASAREALYGSLYNRSQRVIDQASQAQAHLDKGNTSLANFQPQFQDVTLPPVKLDTAPDPRNFPPGKALLDGNGVTHRVVNGQWQPPIQ